MEYAKLQRMAVMDKAVSCIVYEQHGASYHETIKVMAKSGWTRLGAGNYGSAWSHNDNPGYVVKVCGRVDGDSYPAWAYYCTANPAVGLPEYEFPTFSMDNSVFMVMMPEYRSCEGLSFGGGNFTEEQREQWQLTCRVLEYGYKPGDECVWNDNTKEYDKWWPKPCEFLDTMLRAHAFFDGKCSWDIHGGNVMIDPRTNQLVVTDPIHCGDNAQMITEITGRPFRSDVHAVQLKMDFEAPRQARPVDLPPSFHEVRFGVQLAQHLRMNKPRLFGRPAVQNLPKMDDARFRWPPVDFVDFGELEKRFSVAMQADVASPKELAAWVYANSLTPRRIKDIINKRGGFRFDQGPVRMAFMPSTGKRAVMNPGVPAPFDNWRADIVEIPERMFKALLREHDKKQRIIADFQRGAQALRAGI